MSQPTPITIPAQKDPEAGIEKVAEAPKCNPSISSPQLDVNNQPTPSNTMDTKDTKDTKDTTTLKLDPIDNNNNNSHGSSKEPSTPKKSRLKPDQFPHHVIFVVHGMGRQLEGYERNVSYLVENTKTVLQSQFHDLETDVHIIPIEWHAKLHSMVDQRMALTSLRTVPKVRLVMNDYFADILYYFNNHYGAEIIKLIVDELNEAYSTFIAHHSDFNGKISIYALSLGGVAMFDILTCMDDSDDDDDDELQKEAVDKNTKGSASDQPLANDAEPTSILSEGAPTSTKKPQRIRKQDQPKFRTVVPKLKFRPNFLFTVGSPVGAVMVMRNLDWETFHPPDDIIHQNLFHPFDPLAYRIEPLIDPVFAAIPAVTLASMGNSQLFPISLPSLPTLPSIPGSISLLWEIKVPALPRPSIPSLSTLTQMTQSLKAGKWIPGIGVAEGSSNGSRAPTAMNQEQERIEADGSKAEGKGLAEDHRCQENPPSNQLDNSSRSEPEYHSVDRGDYPSQELDDSDASVSEVIAAATAATYLNQRVNREEERPATMYPIIRGEINTTTTEMDASPSLLRRPSLRPRRVSSRIEDEERDESDQDDYSTPVKVARPRSSSPIDKVPEANEVDSEQQRGDRLNDQLLTIQSSDWSQFDEVPPSLNFEYHLGMEKGPSKVEEEEQGRGAKSNAVQEEMIRSEPLPPTLDIHANHNHEKEYVKSGTGSEAGSVPGQEKGLEDMQVAHEEKEKTKQDTKDNVAISEGESADAMQHNDSDANEGANRPVKADTTPLSPIHVEGRPTKVPYRIDHVLQETRVDQYTNEYLLGMTSHFKYWGNRDIMHHILKCMLQEQLDDCSPSSASTTESGHLNLTPDMPTPVRTPKNAKEGAEAKAKAATTAYHREQNWESDSSTRSQSNRKSFSFSLRSSGTMNTNKYADGGYGSSSSSRNGYYRGYRDDNESLYGHRFSDLDMSSAANVSFSNSTLFQNSPFASGPRTNQEVQTIRPNGRVVDETVEAAVMGHHRHHQKQHHRGHHDAAAAPTVSNDHSRKGATRASLDNHHLGASRGRSLPTGSKSS
ncbi:hypothetical protein BGZ50_004608 [Haplosporangium sp. Z 11]|nr:hypothetical protein BGZ50_004608 [Haplosporangium sp. Z 11]